MNLYINLLKSKVIDSQAFSKLFTLLAPYNVYMGEEPVPSRDPMLRINPLLRSFIPGRIMWVKRIIDIMLQFTSAPKSSSFRTSAKRPHSGIIPTLLINIPMGRLLSSFRNLGQMDWPSVKSTAMVFSSTNDGPFSVPITTSSVNLFKKYISLKYDLNLLISSATFCSLLLVLLIRTTFNPEAAAYYTYNQVT